MAHQFPFIDTNHSQSANTIANLRADYAEFGVDSSVNLNLAGVGTFSNTVSFGATVNVTATLVDDSSQVGAAGSILSSTGSGIRWVPAGEGNTASASNVGTNANATNAEQWLTFVGANSSNNPIRVDDDLRYNPSTNYLTTGGLIVGDGSDENTNNRIRLGANQDLEIFHDAKSGINDGRIVDNVGHLILETSTNKDVFIKTGATQKTNLRALATQGVELYFDGNERLKTTDAGVTVTGAVSATTFSGALTGNVTGNTSGSSGSCSGNAATATALQNARTIGGTSFDGTANINPGVAEGLTGTPSIDVTNIDIAGTLTDKNDAVGTSGQILTSTADGVAWASVGDQAAEVAVANEATDTTCFPVFALKATGTDIELKSNTAFKFNSDTGELEASKFAISSGTSNQFLKGDGSVDTTTYLSSIADEAITLAKIQHIDTSRILGRTTASAGDVEVLTKANVLTLLNVADGAEVNVQSDWNQATNTADDFIKNKPTLVTAFTGLSDTPGSLTASKFVKVNAAANALEFVDDPNTNTTYDLSVEQTGGNDANPVLRLGDGTTNDDITITGGTNVFVNRTSGTELTISSVNTTYGVVSSSANGLAPQMPAAHGGKFLKADATWEVPPNTNTFTGLTDTPANYTGHGSKLVAVNSSANGLEYVSAGTGADVDTFLELTDTPGTFTASKFVKVNAAGNALEFGDDNDTTYGLVSTSANGLAPQLPATHGDKFLKADGSWEVPAYTTDTNTTYTLPASGTDSTDFGNGSAIITLTDNAGTPNTDAVTITAGSNIKLTSIAEGGFTISAQDTNDNTQLTTEAVQDIVGAMFSSNTETRISATYQDDDGTIDLVVDDMTSDNNTTYALKCTKDSDGGATGSNDDPYLFLDASSGTDDAIQIFGGTNCSVTRDDDGKLTITSTDTTTNNLYKLECLQTGTPADNDNPKLSLKTNGGSGSTYTELDSVQITGGTNCTVTRVADGSLTIDATDTNTDTNTTYDLLVPESTTAIRLDPSSGTNDDITITGGTNVTVTRTSGTELTISSVNTTYGLFTTSANGLAPQLPSSHGGKFLKADGSWEVPAYNTSLADKIVEGNTSVEVVDSGTNGHIILTTEGAEAVRVDKDGFMGIGIQDPMDILHLHKGGDGVTNVGMILTHSTSGDSSSSDDGIHMYLSGTAASIDNFEGGGVTIRPDGATNGNVSITTSGTTFQSSVTASSLVKSGGTAAQFLKANGTVDSNTYSTTSHTHTYQAPLTFSTGITNTSNTVTVDAAVTTSVTWTASAGSIHNIDSIAVGSCSAIEYTIFVSNGSNIQSQKVLIMDNGTTAYIQEYAVMSNPNLIVTFTADVSSGNVRLRATPETGISGSTTTKFTKILIV